jgi:hypothetical protein
MVDSSFSVIEKKISDLAGMVVALKKDKAGAERNPEQSGDDPGAHRKH